MCIYVHIIVKIEICNFLCIRTRRAACLICLNLVGEAELYWVIVVMVALIG